MLEASQACGSGRPESGEPSQPSRLAELPSRPEGMASGPAMHRAIERMEITNLDTEIRERRAAIEIAEDNEEVNRLEGEIKEFEAQKKKMKEKVLDDDRKAREATKRKASEVDILDQSWHDSRYHQAIKRGISHSQAWAQEKKRRKAAMHRKAGSVQRREEFKQADLAWHAEFDDAGEGRGI